MGIKLRNLELELRNRLLPASADSLNQTDGAGAVLPVGSQIGIRPGVKASNVIVVPANVVEGDVITVGANTFEVDIVNTDSTVNTSAGDLNNTNDPVQVTWAAHGHAAGDLFRVENEILKILRVIDANKVVAARGRSGTAVATHADGLDIFHSATPPASNIPVGLVTTLTPAAFSPAFVDEFNNALAGAERATAKASTEYLRFTAFVVAAGAQILVVANTAGDWANTVATTEDFANSTDNVWANATFVGGVDGGVVRSELASRAVTAAEELAGMLHFAFPFAVRDAYVQVRAATGELKQFAGRVIVAFTETTTEVLPNTVVTVQNAAAVSTAYIAPFAATDIVSVFAVE